ncbi:conserved hypothetical protein [Alteracholeplasma palmae J233]|uniref:Uncharacterized protein n=1 Tax=Alteracholeplasma palmae (strain ATCC 49389 / J233) TaxID=1318466 RepID=U4KK98_ALTPJ|nr:hypothetical protein [Alteracholeplasma palmae]CCV64119.1 conserved hypothetical protein [Alteracholeplasma palmae J233]
MKRRYDVELFHDILISALNKLEIETDFPSVFYQAFSDGINQTSFHHYSETKEFDESWISKIELYYPSLEKITKTLKSNLKYQEDITIIEKAKKIDSKSVRHLASHTQYIKEVKPYVIPKKILVNHSEIEYGIYENRMIMTLIDKLQLFIEKRLEIISNYQSLEKDTFKHHSKMKLDEQDYEISIEISKNGYEKTDVNTSILQRAKHLYKLINGLKNSEFMSLLRGQKQVVAPIMKTQIILKNPDYKNAYQLWLFLDQYETLGYKVFTTNKQKQIDSIYQKHILNNILQLFSTYFLHDNKSDISYYNPVEKTYKTHLKTVDYIEKPKEIAPIKIDETDSNEYLLYQLAKQFGKMVTSKEKNTTRFKESVKRLNEITDQIIFKNLNSNLNENVIIGINNHDLENKKLSELEDKYEKIQIYRKQKQKDLESIINFEKKIQAEYETLQNSALTEVKEQSNEPFIENFKQESLLLDKKIAKLKEKYRKELLNIKQKQKEKLRKQKEKNKLKLKKETDKQKEKLKKIKK